MQYLQSIHFRQLSIQEKIQLKNKGRPLPQLTLQQEVSSSRHRAFVRKFNSNLYDKAPWLCGCNQKNAFFCFPCLLFGGDVSWTKNGIKDLNHLNQKIEKHKVSGKHLNNMLNLSMLGTVNIGFQIDSGYATFIRRHNDQVTKNRLILSKIIDCIRFCGKFELPLRGHDETSHSTNPGVFRGLIDFACELDSTLREHMSSNAAFKGTSKTIQNDILDSILCICQNYIKSEILKSDFMACMTDETTDIQDKSQMVVVFRYEVDGKLVERFWSFFNPPNLTAEALFTILLRELQSVIGNSLEKLIAQTYDGAANLSGSRSGVQTRVKEQYPFAHFIHCYAHKLNLVVQKSCSQNKSVRVFFNNLSGIPTYFSNSSQRMAVLDEVAHRRIPRSSATRWNFKSRIVQTVYELHDPLLECCSILECSLSESTGNGASGIKRMLNDPEFLFWLNFFNKVMPHVDVLFGQLQSTAIDAVKASSNLAAFLDAIQKVRDELSAEDVVDTSIDTIESAKRRYNASSIKVREAKEVCDTISMQCKERFNCTSHLEASKLLQLENASDYAKAGQFPITSLRNCVSSYPMLDQEKLKNELILLYSRQDLYPSKKLLDLLHSLASDELRKDVFPEVIKLLKIVLTTPMTTAEPERCFSTLKRIKTFLRSTTNTERLSALAMISIADNMISEIKEFNSKVIDHFATAKSRRIELIYK